MIEERQNTKMMILLQHHDEDSHNLSTHLVICIELHSALLMERWSKFLIFMLLMSESHREPEESRLVLDAGGSSWGWFMESWLDAGETWSEELVKELLSRVAESECGPWLWFSHSEEFSLELWPMGEGMEGWRCPTKGSCKLFLMCFLLGGSGGALSALWREGSYEVVRRFIMLSFNIHRLSKNIKWWVSFKNVKMTVEMHSEPHAITGGRTQHTQIIWLLLYVT